MKRASIPTIAVCPPALLGARRRSRAAAFTLTEVMIAIALVLVLIVGVAQVFQMTSRTISAGQALQALTRDARAAESTMVADVEAMVSANDQPAIILWSQRTYAFLNENEASADLDGQPQTMDHGNGVEGDEPGEHVPPAYYNTRNHRIDILSFFVNGHFRRQTGATAAELITTDAASEAWISYGHLMVPRHPDDSAPPNPPGTFIPLPSASPDSAYGQTFARNWILGRNVILLSGDAAGAIPKDVNDNLSPLRPNSPAPGQLGDGRNVQLVTGRFDVANTSLRDYFTSILNAPDDWYREALLFRFEADPTPDPAGGYDAAEIARTTPIFLRNCTGIAVEYAGDFLGQYDHTDNPNDPSKWGAPYTVFTHPTIPTDGKIDYYYDPPNHAGGVKKIRWYGMPRDTNNDGAINFIDVVPLRDIWHVVYDAVDQDTRDAIGPRPPFEKHPGDVFPGATVIQNASTASQPESGLGYLDPDQGMRDTDAYLCVWGPTDRKPSMIRITLFLNDPNNRLPEGQVFQYVLRVP